MVSDLNVVLTKNEEKKYTTSTKIYNFEDFTSNKPACPITKYTIENLTLPTSAHPTSSLALSPNCADPCK